MTRISPLELDIDTLPQEVATVLKAAVRGHSVVLSRSEKPLGELEFKPSVLDGLVLPPNERSKPQDELPRGATVVVTAMALSDAARSKLADGFGDGYVLLDLKDAPPTTDVLLIPPSSLQLIATLRKQFPHARIVVTEIMDPDMGIHYSGPVARMLSAGASMYLPPKSVEELSDVVRRRLENDAASEIGGSPRSSRGLPSTDKEL